MSIHHNKSLNFSHSPYKKSSSLSDINLEIKRGELRLRYVKLLRDIHTSLSEQEANSLIEESFGIWEKFTNQKFNTYY